MLAPCTINRSPDGHWQACHDSPALGHVEVTGTSRAEALKKIAKELQYRLELCPCSGEVLGSVELQVANSSDPNSTS